MIELDGLTKRYGAGAPAVDGLSLTARPGEVVAFLGQNGAGKTTTIRLVTGLLAATAGRATVLGRDAHEGRAALMRQVGYVPDQPVFYDYLRGRELLEFVAAMHGFSRSASRQRAGALLTELGLEGVQEEFAAAYSLGTKKKLALACALVHEPSVLILDEPISGLDPRAARQINERLRLAADAGATVFLSTHLLDMAERIADRVAIISGGRLVAEGEVAEVKAQAAAGGSLEAVFMALTAPEGGPP